MGGLVAHAGVEDVEVPREGEGDDVDVVVPGVTDLVVIDAGTDGPGGYGLACFDVPVLDGAISGGCHD